MPAITYADFGGGLDRRLSVNSQDANKLWQLKNAYITLAKRIKKRPALRQVSTGGLTGSFGLKAVNGALCVFVDRGAAYTPPGLSGLTVSKIELDPQTGFTIGSVRYADLFQGYLYVVAAESSGGYRHHYVDNKTSTVTITNAAPGVVTWTAHGLQADQEVRFTTTGTLPDPLVVGTKYYVRSPGVNDFQLASAPGGAAINTTTAGSGVHTAWIPTYITDANCPHTAEHVTKAASRIFAPNGENVRYCAAGAARNWTTASDAGFLPAALQQDTKGHVKAVGTFQNYLVALFEDSAQLWSVAVDPSANAISKRLYGVGTKQPLSLASFFSDLVFMAPFGFRSMTVQVQTDRIDDNDVGVPIDSLVRPDIATTEALVDGERVRGYWISDLGQYWAVMQMGSYSKAWVYTFSKSSKVAGWSEYTFPVIIRDITSLAGKVYLRDNDHLYEVSDTQYTDAGTAVSVEVQMAFQDAKSPGVAKQVYGADVVATGAVSLSFKFDPRDTTLETGALTIPGDTRPGELLPVDVVSPAIAPVFRHSANETMSIDALTLYYHALGAV